ncbi:MAG: hypothetical protein O3A20_06730 [Planctomycetota bacterium]|nr:hypothetical protein [Planctomycetota bacterium]
MLDTAHRSFSGLLLIASGLIGPCWPLPAIADPGLELSWLADPDEVHTGEWFLPLVMLTNRSAHPIEVQNPLLGGELPAVRIQGSSQTRGREIGTDGMGCGPWQPETRSRTVALLPGESAFYLYLLKPPNAYAPEAAREEWEIWLDAYPGGRRFMKRLSLLPGEGCGERLHSLWGVDLEEAEPDAQQLMQRAETLDCQGREDDALFIAAWVWHNDPRTEGRALELFRLIAERWPERDFGRYSASLAVLLSRQIEEQRRRAGGSGGETEGMR